MTVCDLADSLGGHIGSFPRERLTSTGGKRTSALQNPQEAAGTQGCSLCKVGIFYFEAQ